MRAFGLVVLATVPPALIVGALYVDAALAGSVGASDSAPTVLSHSPARSTQIVRTDSSGAVCFSLFETRTEIVRNGRHTVDMHRRESRDCNTSIEALPRASTNPPPTKVWNLP